MKRKEDKNNSNSTILATWFDGTNDKNVTTDDYLTYVNNQDKDAIANFIYYRLYIRYINPFQYNDKRFINKYKNGFSIMANCCLLIETLQSFKNGWEDSKGKSKNAFKQFFKQEQDFIDFRNIAEDFHTNVRCGILHQGETKGGWKIKRGGLLYDSTHYTILLKNRIPSIAKILQKR